MWTLRSDISTAMEVYVCTLHYLIHLGTTDKDIWQVKFTMFISFISLKMGSYSYLQLFSVGIYKSIFVKRPKNIRITFCMCLVRTEFLKINWR